MNIISIIMFCFMIQLNSTSNVDNTYQIFYKYLYDDIFARIVVSEKIEISNPTPEEINPDIS